MRHAAILVLVLCASGCAGPAMDQPDFTPSESSSGFQLATCTGPISGSEHATPTASVATRSAAPRADRVWVAHRDGVIAYEPNGSHLPAEPVASVSLPFSDGLGYRFLPDGSAVHDDASLHRLGGDLRRIASWNATRLGGATHHAAHFYSVADGELHVLSDTLAPVYSTALPNWTAPLEGAYDVLIAHQRTLWVGTAGASGRLFVFDIGDPARPILEHAIPIERSDVPIGDANLGPTSAPPGSRQTPWTDIRFSYVFLHPERLFLWRDGAYQGNTYQTVSRFQDLVTINRANSSVERVEQQYIEDNHYGWTRGAHVGPIDDSGQWAMLHVRGTFSLAQMVANQSRLLPGCHVDLGMSSFDAQDAFFQRDGDRVLVGTQNRLQGWSVDGEPGRFLEAEFGKPATDARWV